MVIIAGFIRGTIALLGVCLLGVSGHVESVEPYRDIFVVHTNMPIALSYGGWIVSWTDDPRVWAHEYGHYEQESKYQYLHEFLVVIPSLVSAVFSRNSAEHLGRWFEQEATALGSL